MYRIPEKKKWVQVNNSDNLGNIFASQNIDPFDNEGRIRVGSRLVLNTSETDDSDFGLVTAIKVVNNIVYLTAGAKVFKNGANFASSNFTEETTSGVPTNLHIDYTDMSDFNGYLYISANSTTVYKTDGSTYSSFTAGSSSGSSRLFCQYGDRMYMTDGFSKIISWNTSDTVATSGQYTLSFQSNAETRRITFMRSSASRIWIGTLNTQGGKGAIYEWDGSSTQPSRIYRLESTGALACVIKDDIPYVMDCNGNVLAWNGGNFQYITGFNKERHQLMTNSSSSNASSRFIHHNGMSVIEGRIHLAVNGLNADNTGTIEETIPSGVYAIDDVHGLVHIGSFGLSKSGDTITDYGQIRISRIGALSEINLSNTSASRNGTFLVGAQIYTDATTTKYGIWYDDLNNTLQKAATIVTAKLDSPNISDTFQNVYVKYKKFTNSSDKLVVKYRTEEVDTVEATITWTSTTTFTTTTNISSFVAGDEVTVIQGLGSGKLSHITTISENAGTYTVTVDETYTGATGTSKARFDKWVKAGSLSNQISTYLQGPIGRDSNWIQIKIWLLVTGRKQELEEILISNVPKLRAI